MAAIENPQISILQQLTKKQRHAFSLLFFILLAGGSALSFVMSIVAPSTNAGIYVFLVQISCILGHLFIFRAAKVVRTSYIAVFFLVIGAALFIGLQR